MWWFSYARKICRGWAWFLDHGQDVGLGAAVEGSAWDIGAPLDERGAGLAEELGSSPGPASREDTRSS